MKPLIAQGIDYKPHAGRGRFNAIFFRVRDRYINWHVRDHKARVFADLPQTVVELGPGVGANMRYLPRGCQLIAVEPNPHMHTMLAKAAARCGVELEIRDVVGERIDLPDASVDAVISSLVLCTVSDPALVLAEVRRILRPAGRYSYVEHVAACEGSPTRLVQRVVRRPWASVFKGCSCERPLQTFLEASGFEEVHTTSYRIHSPFVPFNTQISGYAMA